MNVEVISPFRRLFARVLDYLLYFMIWVLVLSFVSEWWNLSEYTLAICYFVGFFLEPLIMALCIEPFLLHWFGTTFGKWLLEFVCYLIEEEKFQ